MPSGYITPREIKCAGCGTLFLATGTRSKWCSRKCMDAKIWRDKHPQIRHTKKNKYGVSQSKRETCLICGGSMDNATTKDYCSGKCNSRAYALRSYWKLEPKQYRAMVDSQNNACAICGDNKAEKALHIDHDHSCCDKAGSCGECVRGLLCNNCNWGIGRFFDNPELLRNAADYLENPPGVPE